MTIIDQRRKRKSSELITNIYQKEEGKSSENNMTTHQKGKKNSSILIYLLILIPIMVLSLLGMFIFEWTWLIFLPVTFIIVVIFQGLSHQFWDPQKKCPQCNASISLYSDYCRNCGYQLIKKCPKCATFLDSKSTSCDKCGFQFQTSTPGIPLVIPQEIQKDAPTSGKANFCPNCGNKLDLENSLKFCPYCGGKIT